MPNHAQRQKLVERFRQPHGLNSLPQANFSHICFIACGESRGRLRRKWGDGIKLTSCPSQLRLCGAHGPVERADLTKGIDILGEQFSILVPGWPHLNCALTDEALSDGGFRLKAKTASKSYRTASTCWTTDSAAITSWLNALHGKMKLDMEFDDSTL